MRIISSASREPWKMTFFGPMRLHVGQNHQIKHPAQIETPIN
jgi:hypothetical protein